MKNMKKTNYSIMVRDSVCYGAPIYRRVWVNEDGEYFVKFEGNIWNVTSRKYGFVPDC